MLYVEGKVKTRSYEDKERVKKYATEIIAENVNLSDKKEVVKRFQWCVFCIDELR